MSKEQCQAESIAQGFQGFGQVRGGDCCLKKFNPSDVPNNLKFDGNVEFCYWFVGNDPVPPDYRHGPRPQAWPTGRYTPRRRPRRRALPPKSPTPPRKKAAWDRKSIL